MTLVQAQTLLSDYLLADIDASQNALLTGDLFKSIMATATLVPSGPNLDDLCLELGRPEAPGIYAAYIPHRLHRQGKGFNVCIKTPDLKLVSVYNSSSNGNTWRNRTYTDCAANRSDTTKPVIKVTHAHELQLRQFASYFRMRPRFGVLLEYLEDLTQTLIPGTRVIPSSNKVDLEFA